MTNEHLNAELVRIKARMVRNGVAPDQLQRWWSPDADRMVDPMDDPETKQAIRLLLGDLWKGAL